MKLKEVLDKYKSESLKLETGSKNAWVIVQSI